MRRIIGAGLPRTGTTSLTAALEILGFGPVLHSCPKNERARYARLLDAKALDPDADVKKLQDMTGESLAEVTAPWTSTLDSPCIDFYSELHDLYPDSVVILSVRDSDEAWWKSWYGTFGFYLGDGLSGFFRRAIFWPIWDLSDQVWMNYSFVSGWRRKYGCYGPRIHQRHNAEVIRRIPKEKLLVFNVKEGWEPLCNFLGVDIPNEPFPRVNETSEVLRSLKKLKQRGAMRWGLLLMTLACGTYSIRPLSIAVSSSSIPDMSSLSVLCIGMVSAFSLRK